MDASTTLALMLAAGPGAPAPPDTAIAATRAAVETAAVAPASPSPVVLAGLSRLALEKVRVRDGAVAYVLRRPRFEAPGIGWQSVDGFPRRRPALLAGADWDSVDAPANPLPWREGMWLETAVERRGAGAVLGGLAGGVSAGCLGAWLAGYGSGAAPIALAGLGVGTVLGAAAGSRVGHLLFDPPSRWEPIPGASPVRLRPGAADAAPTDAGEAAGEALSGLPPARLRVRTAPGGRHYELEGGRFDGFGVSYRRAVGFPRPRPALFAGRGWDSVPPPPRPIPWAAIESVERAHTRIGLGTVLGGVVGAAAGTYFGMVLLMSSMDSGGEEQLLLSAGVLGGVLGAALGHGFLDPGPRWEPVYARERP